MLNNSENGRHSCLPPDFSGKVPSVSIFGKIIALKYIYTLKIILKKYVSISTLLRLFIKDECKFLLKTFQHL